MRPNLRQINLSSYHFVLNSVLWKTRQNFGLKSRLIFWAKIICLEQQFHPPDVLPQVKTPWESPAKFNPPPFANLPNKVLAAIEKAMSYSNTVKSQNSILYNCI